MHKKIIISNNYFKKKNIFLIILLLLLLLLLIYFIYFYKKKTIESFFNAKRYILENCNNNWAINFNKSSSDCKKATWVTDPKYLCAICDNNRNKNLSMLKAGDKTYFGCDSVNASNSYGLQWQKDKSLGTYTKLGNFVTDLLTCNTFNVNVTSGMYVFLCCDDYASFTINGQTTYKNEGWNFMGMYYIDNVKFGDTVNLSFQNVCLPGGFNISYIWNKQLFIMDQNGYENVANIINYTVTGNTGWDNEWQTGIIYNDILPPWMYNWMSIPYCNSCSGCTTTSTMSFKIGDTKNKGSLNGDLQGWLGIDDTLSVYINNKLKHTQANVSSWAGTYNTIGWIGSFTVSNVAENSIIKIVGYNGGGPAGLGFTYLWNGLIFCLPSTLENFNNCAFQMSYDTQNEEGGMSYANGENKNFPWETDWLNFSTNVGNFQLTTKVSTTASYIKWVYSQTRNTYYTLLQSSLIGNWSTTNIKNSATMSIAFWINISTTNTNWRNIFHVSNQNVDCCNSGNRIPAMWICPNNTQVYIRHSTSSNGDDGPGCSSYQIPLNTSVFLTIVFNSTTMTFYANAISEQTYTYSAPLISADSTASFYMADPWYGFGGFQIKNFTLYNDVFNSTEVSTLYQKEMTISENFESMNFEGNGCCRFNGYQANSMGYVTEDSCKNSCLADDNCVAADIARPNSSNQYDCYNFYETIAGGVSTLAPQCGTTDPTEMCFKKGN